MSAAPLPETIPSRWSTTVKAACFTPLSYFTRCLDLDSQAQLLCFSLIMVETLGCGRTKDEIEMERFEKASRVSRESVYSALTTLENSKMIQIGRGGLRNRPTYSIADEYIREVHAAGREKIPGRCPDCKEIAFFESRFIPLPHAALRKLGACVDPATFKCVMVVCRYTLSWNNKERCIEVTPSELDIHDFERLTGLESRQITNGLTQAVELGLIGRQLRKGRPSIFWAQPEKFGALERREPRKLTRVASGVKEETKPGDAKTGPISQTPVESDANESRSYFYGQCSKCRHYVFVEPVTEEELRVSEPEKPEKPPRAGPQREKKTKWDATKKAIWEMFVAK